MAPRNDNIAARRIRWVVASLLAAGLLWGVLSVDSQRPRERWSAFVAQGAGPQSAGPKIRGDEAATLGVDSSSVAWLFGDVRDSSGSPVESAKICAVQTPLELPVPTSFCTRSNEKGEYRLTLAGATWVLGASRSGWAPSQVGPGRRSGRVMLEPGESRRVDFALLAPGRKRRGIVKDAFGGSISGALVVVGRYPGVTQPGALTLSDENGEFSLTVRQDATSITAYAPGYFPGTTNTTDIDVEIVLTPETLARGVVVRGTNQQPVPGAMVFARGSGTSTMTDESGRFELSLNPNRSNTLVASTSSGYASVEIAPTFVGEHEEVRLHLQPAADLEILVVVGQKKDVCEDGFIRLESPLDVWGYIPVVGAPVAIQGVPPGPQSMRVGCRGALEAELKIELREGLQREEVVLEPAPVLTGHVLAADGSPAMAQVSFLGETSVSDLTTLEGEFVADYLPPGHYEIEARSEQLGEGTIVAVDTSKGDIDVELRMRTWASVRGRVFERNGGPVAGLPLSLVEQPEPKPRGLTTTSVDGSFEFTAVRSGSLGIFARGILLSREGERMPKDHVDFVHDESVVSDLEILVEERSRVVNLHVTDEAGEPLPGVRVTLIRSGADGLDFAVGTQSSDLDGEIEFEEVPEGPLLVRWPDGSVEMLLGNASSFELEWQP